MHEAYDTFGKVEKCLNYRQAYCYISCQIDISELRKKKTLAIQKLYNEISVI